MIYENPVCVELYFFQDRIPRVNYLPVNFFFWGGRAIYAKKCYEVAQEYVGTDSLKVLTLWISCL